MPTRVLLKAVNGNLYREEMLDERLEVSRLIPMIIMTLKLPTVTEVGRGITYHLAYNGHRLQANETLGSAKVGDGDTLVVVPEMFVDYAALLDGIGTSNDFFREGAIRISSNSFPEVGTSNDPFRKVGTSNDPFRKVVADNAPFPKRRDSNVASTILVSLQDINGNLYQQTRLDADAEVVRLIPRIITTLRLLTTGEDGRRVTYHLAHNGRRLQENATLASAEVRDGDALVVVPETADEPVPLVTQNVVTLSVIAPPGFTLHSTLEGHTGAINQIAWSPDGTTLASSSDDNTIRLCQGTYYLTLQGHSDAVTCIAWSPNGDMLASGSSDNTIRIWNAKTGRLLQSIERYAGSVNTLAWSPTRDMLASGYADSVIRVWDVNTRKLLLTFKGHTGSINSVAWSPIGDMLASGSSDNTICIWNVHTEQQLQLYGDHEGDVYSVAWSPNGRMLVSASQDSTIRIWDIPSGKRNRTIEVQSLGGVSYVSFSSDGRFLASLTATSTVQIWRSDVWDTVATLHEDPSYQMFGVAGRRFRCVAFHPKALTLATPDTNNRAINIWELDIALLLKPLITTSIHYVNAKVVLLGDTGVGKTGLGLVLTGKSFVPTISNHGRHVWLFDSTEVNLQDEHTETHEILLWDLAGQHGYRLIHQIHLNEIAIALVVFDARSGTDPFAGVQYWSRALRQVQQMRDGARLPIKKFLVAARTDRDGISVSHERVMRFVQECGFDGYFETSAMNGKNIPALIERIKQEIDWTALPRVSSTSLFQQIKTFLLAEKETGRLLSTIDDLYRAFLRFDKAPVETPELYVQFEKCIGRIEAQGLLQRLSFGNLVLLQPELLDAYASALINAIKNEPDDVGCIIEEKARTGMFAVSSEYRLKDREQEKLLLIAMIEDLLRHEIALREQEYLIFPSEATRENPDLPDPKGKKVIFNFEGPVANIYTVLVVRLSRSGFFKKKDLWKNGVTYTTPRGGTCGLFLSGNSDEGRGELTLFFEDGVSEETQFNFEEFIYTQLQRRTLPDSIKRKPIIVCPECGTSFTDQQITIRLKRGLTTIICVCDREVSLGDKSEAPTSVIKTMDAAADSQREYAATQSTLDGKRAIKDFDVFLCHHGIDKAEVKKVGTWLRDQGLLPWLDEWELPPGRPWHRSLEQQIGQIKSAAVFVGKNGVGPWQRMEIDAFLRKFVRNDRPVIPVLLEDAPSEPELPLFLEGMTWVDFRKQDPDPMEQLIWGITGKIPG